jgi:hypothetical protein
MSVRRCILRDLCSLNSPLIGFSSAGLISLQWATAVNH